MYYTKEQIERANQVDLVAFLKSQGEPLVKSGKEYRWKTHDSMTVYQNKWFRHSRSTGGKPIDFVMEFYGKTFVEAVEMLIGEVGVGPAEEAGSPAPSPFRLPLRAETNQNAIQYLTEERGLHPGLVEEFIKRGDIYQEKGTENVVFVGRDPQEHPRYAHTRNTKERIRKDTAGSEKKYGFAYRGNRQNLFVFEAPIDLLSFICMYPKKWQEQNYISLGGTSEKALQQFLSDNAEIKNVFLCLDQDNAGQEATERLKDKIPKNINVYQLQSNKKDWNEDLLYSKASGKNLPHPKPIALQEEGNVKTICLANVKPEEVEFLWYPYIPFGKLTIIQGNPGEGKTFLAMAITAAVTTGGTLPGMELMEPASVIYQTAEDGLGDTIVPRLKVLHANLNRVHTIDDRELALSLDDGRLEQAIKKHHAKLLILDPIQAFLGANVDMNRANEVRPIFRKLAEMAARTHCAVILIGHLNKSVASSSTYRGLGSIDIAAVVRSILFVCKVKKEPEKRMIVHEKSSLAPPGATQGFKFVGQEDEEHEGEAVFQWLGTFDLTADELLAGVGETNRAESKKQSAIKLLEMMLSNGNTASNKEILERAESLEISERTIQDAKKELGGRLSRKKIEGQWWFSLKEAS